MHVWARRWQVTLTWARRDDSPWHTTRYVTVVDTPEQLRDLITRGRGDRLCTGVRYEPVREMVGQAPETCPAGHPLEGPSALRAAKGWITCSCGGHITYTCAQCGATVVDPVPDTDCVPAANAARLHAAIEELDAGGGVRVTMEQLREMELGLADTEPGEQATP